MAQDNYPWIKATKEAKNLIINGAEVHGNKPLLETDAPNTKLSKLKFFAKHTKNNSIIITVIALISGLILLQIEYGFFVPK